MSDGYPQAEGGSLSGYKSAQLDALIRAAETELDPQKYSDLLRQIGLVQNQEAVDGYLWTAVRYAAASSNVKAFIWYPAPGHFAYEDNVHLWEM